MTIKCIDCGREFDPGGAIPWQCPCGGALWYEDMPRFTRGDIRAERKDMWRYDFAYPLKKEELAVTYNEGMTPLVPANFAPCKLSLKLDSLMPTGSFKDRGTVMVVNTLLKQGVKKITEDSSGNAGASVAGYCALGGIPCDIFVPAGNSAGKLIQIRAYGANIHEISGSREDVAAAAQQDSASYAGHNWHPMFVQGTKSLAYELWEQNGFAAPENIVAVAGNGSCALGLWQGFRELLFNGEIETMPRIFVVQSQNCDPIRRAFEGLPAGESLPTVAEGIRLASPNKGKMVAEAARETGGRVISVGEEAIISALRTLMGHGFYVEPTSATAYAGLEQLVEEGDLSSDDRVVMIVSGNGLKAGAEIYELLCGAEAKGK